MISLKAEKRKENAGKTRKEGKIPAILYGPGIENLKLAIDEEEFEKIISALKETERIEIDVKGGKFFVLVRKVQRHPITGKILHVDFFQPSSREEIEVCVPLSFINTSEAIENSGAILVKNLKEIEVKCFLSHLPEKIFVDLSKLKTLEDKILVSDLKVPEKVKILRKPEEIVAFLVLPEAQEEPKESEKIPT